MDAAGDFVVAWQSYDQVSATSDYDVYARRYSRRRRRVGQRIPGQQRDDEHQNVLGGRADGRRGVRGRLQSSFQEGSPNYGIYAQRYSAAGAALGGEVHVNTSPPTTSRPDGRAAADGDFVVAWQSLNQASGASLNDVYAQRYTDLDNNGDTLGPAVAAVTRPAPRRPVRPGDRLAGPVTGFVSPSPRTLHRRGTTGPTSATTGQLPADAQRASMSAPS